MSPAAGRFMIRAERMIAPGYAGVLRDGAVLVEQGRIVAVDCAMALDQAGVEVLLSGKVLMPGFIDMHVHGAGGHGFGDGAAAVVNGARAMAETGVTTFYAGLGAGPSIEAIAETVAAAASAGEDTGGARCAGIFMEGPFISVEKRGAWDPRYLRPPSVAELQLLIEAADGHLRRVNVAPELPNALEFIRAAREHGVVISLGHSNATYDEAVAGIDAGATIANHTFNAMSGLDHRQPGLAGATLAGNLLAELILDGVHVHPAAAKVLLLAKGRAGVALITDGSQLTGLEDGVHERGGRTVTVADGSARLPDGTLAGSVSTFDRDLRNAAAWLTDDLAWLAEMSAGNAARAMGIWPHTGSIEPGKDADLVLLDDDLHVDATLVGGVLVYERSPAHVRD